MPIHVGKWGLLRCHWMCAGSAPTWPPAARPATLLLVQVADPTAPTTGTTDGAGQEPDASRLRPARGSASGGADSPNGDTTARPHPTRGNTAVLLRTEQSAASGLTDKRVIWSGNKQLQLSLQEAAGISAYRQLLVLQNALSTRSS